MIDIPLPASLEIRHRFLTASVGLTVRTPGGPPLFEVRCPALRLRRSAQVWAAGREPELLFWMAPVWGLSWNVQLNQPNDDILGVLQREKDDATGGTQWVAIDGRGNRVLAVRPGLTSLQRLRKHLTLFSSESRDIVIGDKAIGTFTRRSGVVHEAYEVELDPVGRQAVDAPFVLAAAVVSTGIFDRLFT